MAECNECGEDHDKNTDDYEIFVMVKKEYNKLFMEIATAILNTQALSYQSRKTVLSFFCMDAIALLRSVSSDDDFNSSVALASFKGIVERARALNQETEPVELIKKILDSSSPALKESIMSMMPEHLKKHFS